MAYACNSYISVTAIQTVGGGQSPIGAARGQIHRKPAAYQRQGRSPGAGGGFKVGRRKKSSPWEPPPRRTTTNTATAQVLGTQRPRWSDGGG